MKILELTRSFYPSIGGMEKFVNDRLQIYKSLGFKYQVIATTHSEKKLNSGKRLDDVLYLSSFTPYEVVPILKNVLDREYDILSVNQVGYFYSDYAINKAFGEGKKILLTPHFYFHTERYKFVKKMHYKWILPKTLVKVTKIICFTEYEANFWIKNFPKVKTKIEIIPHYFKSDNYTINRGKNKYKDYLLFLGRGEINKRIDLLIQTFDRIQSDYNLVLTVDKDEISTSLNELVMNNERIHLLGRVTEERKQNLLANCTALILPTDFEAFGIVNFEASYYKKPILLSELEVFKNILDSKGVIYFKNNLNSIEKAIKDFILLNEREKEEMGRNNYINLENFTFDKIVKKYGNLFEKLIEHL